ncbi:ABC transporter permease [Paenibacillus sp. GCM10012307]|uniref:ABC transporter permease n=1 Tax=Paenibacillus sp. GCM10012307 TaxID=3317343 RepID=UPI0036069CF8
MDSFVPIIFVIFAVLVYTATFAQEIHHRFLVYTRLRIPLNKWIRIKFFSNFVITFAVFFIFVFSYFIFAYYIEPRIGFVSYNNDFYQLNNTTQEEYTYTQNTFSQLLAYGNFTYGIFYSLWVGLNAAVYASLAFYLVLVIGIPFLGLSIPFILYLVQSFFMVTIGKVEFQLTQSLIPFNYTQLPIWTAFVPFSFLVLLCVVLAFYLHLKIERMSHLQ